MGVAVWVSNWRVPTVTGPLRPKENRTEPWGSMSTSSTLKPPMAKAIAMLTADVVFPTPPFSLENTMVVGIVVGSGR